MSVLVAQQLYRQEPLRVGHNTSNTWIMFSSSSQVSLVPQRCKSVSVLLCLSKKGHYKVNVLTGSVIF